MWKITTRGFTLEEVLIMAAMNLLEHAASTAKRENRASQKSQGDQASNCKIRSNEQLITLIRYQAVAGGFLC
jgi:hypothetical protein